MIVQFRFRRGSTAEWAEDNPVLADGEPGVDTTLRSWKLGDGATPWLDLAYQSADSALLTSVLEAVTNPRTYTTAQLESATSPVNTTGKRLGLPVFNSTLNQPVWSTGALAADEWVDGVGVTLHTPV